MMNRKGEQKQRPDIKSATDLNSVQSNIKRRDFADELLEEQVGLLQSVMPNKVSREKINHQFKVIKERGLQIREMQRAMGEFEQKAMVECLNQLLINGQSNLKKNSSLTLMRNRQELSEGLFSLRKDFNTVLLAMIEEMESIPVDFLKEEMKDQIRIETRTYYTALKELIVDYQSLTQDLIK